MDSFKEKLLQYYEIGEEAFEELRKAPSFSSLPSISSSLEVEKAIERLKIAKENHQRVLVYGDYDTDGIMSTSITLLSLREYGIETEGYLPNRYNDGYGLNAKNVRKIAKAGYSLIMTVDNGVTAIEAINEANSLGVDVIILDHHEYEVAPKGIVALIHPRTVSLENPSISAGCLSFLFSCSLNKKADEYLLLLGAVSTLSDMMPILSYNREIVRLGLEIQEKNNYSVFSYLTDKTEISSNVLQMEIIPKINAVGRLEEGNTINRLLRYFTSSKEDEKRAIASWMDEINLKRKALTKEAADNITVDSFEEAIVCLLDLKEGLNGLLANRLLEEYGKPVAVFSPSLEDSDILVGSMRSKEGFDILEALKGNGAPFLSGGGHSFAGGVSIRKEDYAIFRKDFIYASLKHKLQPKKEKTIPLLLEEATMENYQILQDFGPFGQGNPNPKFTMNLPTDRITFSKDGRFLSSILCPGVRLFSFKYGSSSFPKGKEAKLSLSFSLNEWKGRKSLDLIVDDLSF